MHSAGHLHQGVSRSNSEPNQELTGNDRSIQVWAHSPWHPQWKIKPKIHASSPGGVNVQGNRSLQRVLILRDRTTLRRTQGSLWRGCCLECNAQGAFSEHPFQARGRHNPAKRCAEKNTHSTAKPVSNAVCLKYKALVNNWGGTGTEQVDWNTVLGCRFNNDSMFSLHFQGKPVNITIYSKSMPWPVMLKKLKLNNSMKTYKTFYNWCPKKMSFILGNWNAK